MNVGFTYVLTYFSVHHNHYPVHDPSDLDLDTHSGLGSGSVRTDQPYDIWMDLWE